MKVIREQILNAVYKSLQWEDGENTGIDMLKLEQQIDGILAQLPVIGLVCKCPICLEEMKGIELIHYKCKKCNEYFTN